VCVHRCVHKTETVSHKEFHHAGIGLSFPKNVSSPTGIAVSRWLLHSEVTVVNAPVLVAELACTAQYNEMWTRAPPLASP
jgi:hypothetical protein